MIVQRMKMSGLGTSSYKKAHVRQLKCRKPYLYRFGQQSTSGKLLLCCRKLFRWLRMGQILLAQSWCTFAVFQSELILCTIISSFASTDSRAGRFPVAALFWRCLFANCLHSAKLQANTWSALLLASARSMMVVQALSDGEIHFHLHFEFRFKLTLYFTLNCISILVLT